jgi:hypothetical protein
MTMIWKRLPAARWLANTDKGDYHVIGVLPRGELTLQYGVVYVPREPRLKPSELGKRSTLANAQLLARLHSQGDAPPNA